MLLLLLLVIVVRVLKIAVFLMESNFGSVQVIIINTRKKWRRNTNKIVIGTIAVSIVMVMKTSKFETKKGIKNN